MDCSLSGSSVQGILQARVLEWVAISFSSGSSQPRDRTRVSRIPGRHFNLWATTALALVKHPCYYSRFLCGSEGLPFITFRQLFLLLFTKPRQASISSTHDDPWATHCPLPRKWLHGHCLEVKTAWGCKERPELNRSQGCPTSIPRGNEEN